jgi:hypothetical protein
VEMSMMEIGRMVSLKGKESRLKIGMDC